MGLTEGPWGHLELAQHRVTALPQMSQVQAPLVIFEPLGQRREGYRSHAGHRADPQQLPGQLPRDKRGPGLTFRHPKGKTLKAEWLLDADT